MEEFGFMFFIIFFIMVFLLGIFLVPLLLAIITVILSFVRYAFRILVLHLGLFINRCSFLKARNRIVNWKEVNWKTAKRLVIWGDRINRMEEGTKLTRLWFNTHLDCSWPLPQSSPKRMKLFNEFKRERIVDLSDFRKQLLAI
jgi:hypothetical protein